MRKPHTDALPWVCLNGRLVPAATACVSVFDRSFQFGDGLFETMRIIDGWPIQWQAHWRRLSNTSRHLKLRPPLSAQDCLNAIERLLRKNRQTSAIARIHLSRGTGPRGYSIKSATAPTCLISLHPPPVVVAGEPRRVRVGLASFRIAGNPFWQRHKTASRLLQVLAKTEAESGGFDDMLLLDEKNHVIEATSSNLFWFKKRTLITPPLSSGILPGTTRSQIIQIGKRMNIPVKEAGSSLEAVLGSDGAFLTVSTSGIIEIGEIAGRELPRNPLTTKLQCRLENQWQMEAGRHGSLLR